MALPGIALVRARYFRLSALTRQHTEAGKVGYVVEK